MEYGKYIIKEVRGCQVAILFSHLISHCDIGTKGDSRGETISAGFFTVFADPTKDDSQNINVHVFGKSTTLKLETGKDDSLYIKRVLRKV